MGLALVSSVKSTLLNPNSRSEGNVVFDGKNLRDNFNGNIIY